MAGFHASQLHNRGVEGEGSVRLMTEAQQNQCIWTFTAVLSMHAPSVKLHGANRRYNLLLCTICMYKYSTVQVRLRASGEFSFKKALHIA